MCRFVYRGRWIYNSMKRLHSRLLRIVTWLSPISRDIYIYCDFAMYRFVYVEFDEYVFQWNGHTAIFRESLPGYPQFPAIYTYIAFLLCIYCCTEFDRHRFRRHVQVIPLCIDLYIEIDAYGFWYQISPCIHFDTEFDRFGRGGGLGSSTIFKKFNEPYAPS